MTYNVFSGTLNPTHSLTVTAVTVISLLPMCTTRSFVFGSVIATVNSMTIDDDSLGNCLTAESPYQKSK